MKYLKQHNTVATADALLPWILDAENRNANGEMRPLAELTEEV
jgi:hypothetical protein